MAASTPLALRMELARERKNVSWSRIAEELGIDQATITKIKRGEVRKHVDGIARILDVPVEWLRVGENPPAWATPPRDHGEPLRTVTLVGAVTAGDGYVKADPDLREMEWKSSWKLMLVEGTSAYPVIYPNQFAIVDTARDLHHNNIVVIQVDNSEEHEADPSKPRVRAYLKRYCKADGAPNGYLLASINSGRDTPYIPDHKILAKIPVVGVLFEDAHKVPSDDETVEVL